MGPHREGQYVLIISIKSEEKVSHHLAPALSRIRQVDMIFDYPTLWFILRVDRVGQQARGIAGSSLTLAVGARALAIMRPC